MMHAIGTRYGTLFVEEKWKWISSFQNVFFAFEQAIDLLCRDEHNGGVQFYELVIGRLKLSQLSGAVGSPGAADEDNHQAFAAIV